MIQSSLSPIHSARQAGLRYCSDQAPGFRRQRSGRGFIYLGLRGNRLKNAAVLRRVRALVIPPAWEEVWICPREDGHIQATGRDQRGRKQYRYHPNWREMRDANKYENMIAFGHALPRIRRRVQRDLNRRGLPREKVLAAVTRLLETSLIRVGNEQYVRENGSFGLTTLRNHHVRVRGKQMVFSFRGKSHKSHSIQLEDHRLSAIVRRCRDLPGQELFAYLDSDGVAVDVTSDAINAYLHEISGHPFTAKHFRTWAGTVLAAQALQALGEFSTESEARHNLVEAIERVAGMLGNTPAICRKSYIHPIILETYLDGSLVQRLKKILERKLARGLGQLRSDEAAVVMLLQQSMRSGPARCH